MCVLLYKVTSKWNACHVFPFWMSVSLWDLKKCKLYSSCHCMYSLSLMTVSYCSDALNPWVNTQGLLQYLRGDVGKMTCRRLLRSVSILTAYEKFIDSNMGQTTFRFGFRGVSQNPLRGLNISQMRGHWFSPECSDGCCRVRATGRLQEKY